MHHSLISALAAALIPFVPVLADDLPTAVRRMPLDPGEKFYPDFAAYSEAPFYPEPTALASRAAVAAILVDRVPGLSSNQTSPNPDLLFGVQPAFRPHGADGNRALVRAVEVLNVLWGRSACPSGFSSCEDIGYSNKCCADSETCVEVDNDDTGDVACCPSGGTCSGDVAACPTSAVSCAASLGGGCCMAGYACQGSGCVKTVTVTQSTSTETSSVTTTTFTSTSTSTDTSAVAPFRPTSDSATSTTTTTSETTSTTLDNCPTGYYACLARYGGGCCQTGRDCQSTSCPAISSTTIISRSDLTIAIAATDTPTTTTSAVGSCATGWSLCAASANVVEGCCPNGYSCGSVSCTLSSSSETSVVGKESTVGSGATSIVARGVAAVVGFVVAVSLI